MMECATYNMIQPIMEKRAIAFEKSNKWERAMLKEETKSQERINILKNRRKPK